MELDYKRLIDKAELLVKSEQLGAANALRTVIQEVQIGHLTYQLQLHITCREEDRLPYGPDLDHSIN